MSAWQPGVIKKMRELTYYLFLPIFPWCFNIETVRFLLEVGELVTLFELTLEQVADGLPAASAEVTCRALPLMASDYCVTGSLLGEKGKGSCPAPCRITAAGPDRKGIVFPVEMDRTAHAHLNSRDLCVMMISRNLQEQGSRCCGLKPGARAPLCLDVTGRTAP